MSTSYRCPHCNERDLSSRNAYSQHVNTCITYYGVSTEESNNEDSEMILDMSLSSDEFNCEERPSVQEEREREREPASGSEMIEDLFDNNDYATGLPSASGSEMIDDLFESDDYAADISVSLEDIRNIPERLEETLSESLRIENLNYESLRNKESDVKNLQNEVSDIESLQNEDSDVERESSRNEDSNIKEFPNEAYADLMTLVTKNNLNNKAGNAIIKFFNKHSDLSISPLPKSIEAGRKYMDKMNLSSHHKHKILEHNNKEYFIYYWPILKCIENLLSNPEISQLFVYNYKKLVVNINTDASILYIK